MTDDCVSWPEMRWTRSQPDPVDAVLNGENGGDDLLEVAVVIHDLRSAFARTEPLERRQELAAFTGQALRAFRHPAIGTAAPSSSAADPPDPAKPGRKRSSMVSALSGFAATLTGKVVLGTAVAAASVGGLHAANVVDVPALPDGRPVAEHRDSGSSPADDKADAATEGKQTADANKSAADAYTDAVKEWTDCVADAAAAQGDEQTRTTGGFDPRAGCGDHPKPADFGLDDLPSQAADAAKEASNGQPNAGGQDPSAGKAGSGEPASPDNPPEPGSTPASPPSTVPEKPAASDASNPGGSRP
jgi:hypothetical protein